MSVGINVVGIVDGDTRDMLVGMNVAAIVDGDTRDMLVGMNVAGIVGRENISMCSGGMASMLAMMGSTTPCLRWIIGMGIIIEIAAMIVSCGAPGQRRPWFQVRVG